jgi:hydroxymethylbilane synthase
VGARLADLAKGARVGTSSLRRSAQLRSVRPDLEMENIRGNVDTRLRKLDEKQYDAIVLASAGLRRLGWESRITELLDPSVMCPAVGQGALAVETRDDGGQAQEISKRLDHRESRIAVTAERAVLAALGGGCQVPIGAYATVEDGRIHLQAVIVSPDGREVIGLKASGAAGDAASIGRALGNQLLAEGGGQILEAVYGA